MTKIVFIKYQINSLGSLFRVSLQGQLPMQFETLEESVQSPVQYMLVSILGSIVATGTYKSEKSLSYSVSLPILLNYGNHI